MTPQPFQAYMGLHTFADEVQRRATLAVLRQAAARMGYRGRVSFRHAGIHGRDRGTVCVTIEELRS